MNSFVYSWTEDRTGSNYRKTVHDRLAASALIALALMSAGFLWPERRLEGPILIYLVDTLRPDRMSVYGAPRETTPSATELAREGAAFENAYAVSTWTRPSVATLLTSLFPAQATTINRYGRLDESVISLPALFQRAGWKTAAFVGNSNIFDERLGFQRGFDVFDAVLGDNDTWKPAARQVVEPALKFIQAQKSPRFFLYVHVVDPHLPYILEPENRALFSSTEGGTDSARESLLLDYDRAIRQADDEFGRLAAALRRKGWWNSAAVVYTADHGEEFYEHGAQGHGRTVYEEQVRVPLILKYPGQTGRGKTRTDPASLADVTPTLARLTGLPVLPGWIGGDLRKPFPRDRELYMTEDMDDVRAYGLRRGSEKVIMELYPKFRQVIYRLDQDPKEQAGRVLPCPLEHEARTAPLLRSLERWHSRDVAAFPAIQFEKVERHAVVVDLLVHLGEAPKPFLTGEEHCRFAPSVHGNRLEIHETLRAEEPFRLRIAADDRGDLPIARLGLSSPEDSRPMDVDGPRPVLRRTRTAARFVQGPTSDEVFRSLRALGYLGGARDADHH